MLCTPSESIQDAVTITGTNTCTDIAVLQGWELTELFLTALTVGGSDTR